MTTHQLTDLEKKLRNQSSSTPNDPLLLCVQLWLYDDPELQTSIEQFCKQNRTKYSRDVDAELWPTSMTALHRSFCTVFEQSLTKMLVKNGYSSKDFDKSIHKAMRDDVTNDDAVLVRLLITATQFSTFEIMLRECNHHHVKLRSHKKKAKLDEFHAFGGTQVHSKHDVPDF